jgi:hypothetical protein
MNRMRKCNDEVYQLAKDQALVKKLKKQKILAFLFLPSGCNVCNSRIPITDGHVTDADEACRSSEISVDLIIIIVFL